MNQQEGSALKLVAIISIESCSKYQLTQALLQQERIEAQVVRDAQKKWRITRQLIKRLIDSGKQVEVGPLCVNTVPVARDSYTVAPTKYKLLRVG